jgi:hypothetical protein
MNYDSRVFIHQLPIVKLFIYHLIYYRTLNKGYKESGLQNEFWTLTIDAHLLRATINWCMVFGSHKSEPTHWKKLFATRSDADYENFRKGLLTAIGVDEDTWDQYWKSMKDFRDKYAVHRELEFKEPVPNFDTALDVAHYYDDWVRKIISPDTILEPPLKSFELSLQKSAVPFVERLLQVT